MIFPGLINDNFKFNTLVYGSDGTHIINNHAYLENLKIGIILESFFFFFFLNLLIHEMS